VLLFRKDKHAQRSPGEFHLNLNLYLLSRFGCIGSNDNKTTHNDSRDADDGDVRPRAARDPAARREHQGLPAGLLRVPVPQDGLLPPAVGPRRQDGLPPRGGGEDGAEGDVRPSVACSAPAFILLLLFAPEHECSQPDRMLWFGECDISQMFLLFCPPHFNNICTKHRNVFHLY